MSHPNKFLLITCNNILILFCKNANNIANIKIVTGKSSSTPLEIEQHFNDCLGYLIANKFIVKTTSMPYDITDSGKAFYRNGGFKI